MRKLKHTIAEPPSKNAKEMRTLWMAKLQLREGTRQDMLFRSNEDFETASKTAQRLLDGSTAAQMAGAQIVSIERIARTWN